MVVVALRHVFAAAALVGPAAGGSVQQDMSGAQWDADATSAKFEWRLAALGEDCVEGCKCLGCVEGQWPNTAVKVSSIQLEDGYRCNLYKSTNDAAAPIWNEGGVCDFSISAVSTCEVKSSPDQRRICPCGRPEARIGFVMGDPRASCTEECLTIGGTCVESGNPVWPSSEEVLKASYTNNGCKEFMTSSRSIAPYKAGDLCYYPPTAATPQCDVFGSEGEQRICACKGKPPCLAAAAEDMGKGYQGERLEIKKGTEKTCANHVWREGTASANGMDPRRRVNATFAYKEDCKWYIENFCNGAVGVTFAPTTGACWCEVELGAPIHDPTLEYCVFDSIVEITTTISTTREPITTSSSSAARLYDPSMKSVAAQAALTRGQALTAGISAVAAASLVTALIVSRRRSSVTLADAEQENARFLDE